MEETTRQQLLFAFARKESIRMSTLRPNKCFQAAANFMSLLFLRRAPAISRTGPTLILFPPFCFDKKNTEGHFFLHLFSKSSSEEKKKKLAKTFFEAFHAQGYKIETESIFYSDFSLFSVSGDRRNFFSGCGETKT